VNVKNLLRAIPLCAATLVVGCSSTPKEPERARIVHEVTAEASVRSVDAATRMIELERADGARILVIAGPEVRNFDQIAVGDTVTARYAETISARQLGPNEIALEPGVIVAAGAAEAGARPAVAIGAGLALTVTVESLDFNENLIVFTDPSGALHAVRPQTGTGRTFIKKLKVGDRVELMFTEEVMLSVEK
jgi:hypothetical protein